MLTPSNHHITMEQELNKREPINLVGHLLFRKFPHALNMTVIQQSNTQLGRIDSASLYVVFFGPILELC